MIMAKGHRFRLLKFHVSNMVMVSVSFIVTEERNHKFKHFSNTLVGTSGRWVTEKQGNLSCRTHMFFLPESLAF